VGRGMGDEIGGDRAAGAGAVLHDELLGKKLAQLLRQETRGDVAGCARRKAHDDAHRPVRISLRTRRQWPCGCRAAEQRNELPSPHGALKPRTTPYHILEWEDCASQQTWALDVRYGSWSCENEI